MKLKSKIRAGCVRGLRRDRGGEGGAVRFAVSVKIYRTSHTPEFRCEECGARAGYRVYLFNDDVGNPYLLDIMNACAGCIDVIELRLALKHFGHRRQC